MSTDAEKFRITPPVYLHEFKVQGVYPISECDWNRLIEMIKKIAPCRKQFQLLAAMVSGIAVSSLFALITFYTVKELDRWVLPTNWALFVVSVILTVAFWLLDKQERDQAEGTAEALREEAGRIEGKFEKPQNNDEADPASRNRIN